MNTAIKFPADLLSRINKVHFQATTIFDEIDVAAINLIEHEKISSNKVSIEKSKVSKNKIK